MKCLKKQFPVLILLVMILVLAVPLAYSQTTPKRSL